MLLQRHHARLTASASAAALLPLTTTPTRDVLRRMPTDLIVAVMDEGVQRHITFAVWDFAGQRVYYSVHHLFITRGVYIVVFSLEDAAHDVAGCLEYLAFWLHSVHAHTADASDYCILLVGTHSDVVDEIGEQARISGRIKAAFEDCGFWPQIEQPEAAEKAEAERAADEAAASAPAPAAPSCRVMRHEAAPLRARVRGLGVEG